MLFELPKNLYFATHLSRNLKHCKYMLRLSLVLIWIMSLPLIAQEHPPVMTYPPDSYGAENQNWGITQTDNQTMYFANNSGLLEFNGSKWTLYPVPDSSIVRSVKAFGNQVFSGSYMDFGVWTRNKIGALVYKSLAQELHIDILEEEQFWNIEILDNWILFQSLSRIYLVDVSNKTVKVINSEQDIWNLFNVNGIIYFAKRNKGIYKIINGEVILVSDDKALASSKLVGISIFEDKIVYITSNSGLFYVEKNSAIPWKFPSELNLEGLSIYCSSQLRDGSLILGTISNGLWHISSDGQIKYNLDYEKGLSNNTILSIYEDQKNNLWLGLDIGISHINLTSRFRVYKDATGQIGTVYASAVFEDNLYLGTNQGLFVKPRNQYGDFKFVEGTSGQVWALRVIDDFLFCGHNVGTLIIKDQSMVTKLTNTSGTWDFKKIPGTNKILQGNYKGLHVLTKTTKGWDYGYKINGFDISSRFFQIIGNDVYINHELRGLYKLGLSKDFTSLKSKEVISSIDKGSGSNFIKLLNNYYYTSANGIFQLDSSTNEFSESLTMAEIFKHYSTTSTLLDVQSTENLKWCFADNNILIISPGSVTDKPNVEEIPVSISNFKNVVAGFENFTKISDSDFLLGSSNGYYILKSDTPKSDYSQNIHINSAQASLKNEPKTPLTFDLPPNLNYSNNNLHFEYSIPQFGNTVNVKYSYMMEGWSNDWSEWQTTTTQVFENLPFGKYMFKVKGKIGNTETLNVASFPVIIKRPWYLSATAMAAYVILLLILSVIIHTIYRRYYKRQQMQLLQKSQKEMALNELENSQKLMRLKNEKLELEIESKNRELAISTMSLIKKNEFLNNIKTELNNQEPLKDLKKVIKIIDNNLNNTDDWKLFKEAFDNADKDFLKLVKERHSNLTPNDLKLCAYLRLNLSSKEIAPLLNISPRSVEVKRYRLRKKMNLAPKISLTNYILDL